MSPVPVTAERIGSTRIIPASILIGDMMPDEFQIIISDDLAAKLAQIMDHF